MKKPPEMAAAVWIDCKEQRCAGHLFTRCATKDGSGSLCWSWRTKHHDGAGASSGERILNAQPAIDEEPMLHVLGPEHLTIRDQRGGDDEGVVDREALALGNAKTRLVDVQSQRPDAQQALGFSEQRMRFVPSHFEFSARNVCDLIHNLNADMTCLTDERSDMPHAYLIAGREGRE